MFVDSLSNEKVTFKSIEEKIYKSICEEACNYISELLIELDNKIFEEVKKERQYRNKGYTTTSIKTIMGVITVKRRKYLEYDITKEKYIKTRYFLDEVLEMNYLGNISETFTNKILETFVNSESYRNASRMCEELTNMPISHEGIRNIVLKIGKNIQEKEDELEQAIKDEELIPSNQKEIDYLFGETDGTYIRLQGKDKEKEQEKAIAKAEKKLRGKELEEEKERIKKAKYNKEIKFFLLHEGWKKVGANRYSLVNKKIAIRYDAKDLKGNTNAIIKNNYNEDKIKKLIINGDGADWIAKICPISDKSKKIYQRDAYHIEQEIRRVAPKELAEKLSNCFKNKEYDVLKDTVDSIEGLYVTDKEKKKYKRLVKYLEKGLKRYQEQIPDMQAPEGIEYRAMGNAETNIYETFVSKLKKKRKSWSLDGALAVSLIMKAYILKNNVIDSLKEKVQRDTSVKDWIEEIEKKAKINDHYRSKTENRKGGYEYPVRSEVIGLRDKMAFNIGNLNIGNQIIF